jgi:hypothetical protein
MSSDRKYGDDPKVIGSFDVKCAEMMFYQYLPVKLIGQTAITREKRLSPFDDIIGTACCDFIGEFGLDRFVESHVYLTVRQMVQTPSASFNRPGYHSDGFLTDDINYIWSDCVGTAFSRSEFNLTLDDQKSMVEMIEQAKEEDRHFYPDKSLLRLDQFVIHEVTFPTDVVLRTFIKVSISKDRYDLKGNSKNYELDYDWPVRERSMCRNVPQQMG